MDFKKISGFVFFIGIFMNAQMDKSTSSHTITKSLTEMVDSFKNKDVNKSLTYIYPKLFQQIPKEQMKMVLNMTYNNPFAKTEIHNFKIYSVSQPVRIEKQYFSVVNYGFRMKLKMEWNNIPNNENMKKSIEKMMVQKYGYANVKYYPNQDFYVITTKMKAYAVSDDTKNWKFVPAEETLKKQIDQVIPTKKLEK